MSYLLDTNIFIDEKNVTMGLIFVQLFGNG